MAYAVTGLSVASFRPLFGLPDSQLEAQGIVRVTAADDGFYPCRVGLRDAEPGETLLLLNYEHLPDASPYQSRHAIFVSERAIEPARHVDEMPAILATRRLISLRAYDAAGMMVEADIIPGDQVEQTTLDFLAHREVAYIHAHNAARGCYAARIDRA
jgi:hypothetical protein